MPKIAGFYVGNNPYIHGYPHNVFHHPDDGVDANYYIYNNFGACVEGNSVDFFPHPSQSNGLNCFNSGTSEHSFPYNGGHPCNRGCGCKDVSCSESGNFFTSSAPASTTPTSDKATLYVPPRMNIKLNRRADGRYYARQDAEAGNVLADVMLNWSHNAWRGKTPCQLSDDPDCVQDGVEPPRKLEYLTDANGDQVSRDGRCTIERKLAPNSSFATVPIKINSHTGNGEVITVVKDRFGNLILDKTSCEAAASSFREGYDLNQSGFAVTTIDDVTGETIGAGPYELKWRFNDFDERKCCGLKVITRKSPWFIPIADDANFGVTNNPNPEREQLGFCYTPSHEVVLIPRNINATGSEGCTIFENQSDRINAKDGFYDATRQSSMQLDVGAYSVIYRGCNYYDACPQENDEDFAKNGDPRGDDTDTAGRALHLIIPQNQMLNVSNLNITRTDKGPFVSSYAGWGQGQWAKYGNPAPYTYYLRTWGYGMQNPDWSGRSSEYSYNKYIPHIIPSKGDTFCPSGGPYGNCRNPSSNQRLTALNLQAQPFAAVDEEAQKYKTLEEAVADQKAHAKCCGVGCALDIEHGLDFWFDHDFNYGAVNCDAVRAAVTSYVGSNTGHIACGDCGDNWNGGGEGPIGYATWFKGGSSCGNGTFPAVLDAIIWDPKIYKTTDKPGSLAFWKKTGLMPFGNFTGMESYVDDNCYGGSLHGKIRKTTNSQPIIIYSDDHKLRPGDEVYVQGVVGNFKANNYDLGSWKAVNYEDKKGYQSSIGSDAEDLPIWPEELRVNCEFPPLGGWAATQLVEKYPYFTVCGIKNTVGEDYAPTQHSYALCTCAGNPIEGFIEKGTNLPECEKDIQVVMNTCTSDITFAEEKTATSTLSGSGPPVVTQGSAVDLGCSGDTLEDRAKPGREEECEQICESYGYCGVIGVYVQKTDSNGDPVRTGSDHAECQDCLEGYLSEVYDDSRHVMSKTECDELAKHYERFVLDAPNEKHYPATKRGTYQGSQQFTPLNWGEAFDPSDPSKIKPQSWLGCPNTGEWNLYQPREISNLTMNKQFNVPLVYSGNSTIPVGTKLFAGGGAATGDLMSIPPHRPDLAKHYYVTLDQDGFCGGCADHYMSAYSKTAKPYFTASITPGSTDDIGDQICGFMCDGSLWWDGYCCNCSVQGSKSFDQLVSEAIKKNCGDVPRVTSNVMYPNDNVGKDANCAYNTELGMRKAHCQSCGCTYRIEDKPIITNRNDPNDPGQNSHICCDCSCVGDPMTDCGQEGENSPACNHPYPTIDLMYCCKPPIIKCQQAGQKVRHGNLECECYVIDAGLGGGDAGGFGGFGDFGNAGMTIYGYKNCQDVTSGTALCTGFPEGRDLACWDKEIRCEGNWCENSCGEDGIPAPYIIPNPQGQTPSCRRTSSDAMIPSYCMNTGNCKNNRSGCKGLGGIDVDLHWTGSNWESDWVLMGDVGRLQCATYIPAPGCATSRCIYSNGGIRIGVGRRECSNAGGLWQGERGERDLQTIPGADCGSCIDQFLEGRCSDGQSQTKASCEANGETWANRDHPTPLDPHDYTASAGQLDPARDGHFIRLSMGCADNVESTGSTGSIGATGAGLLSGESYNSDRMSLAVEVASCGIRTCETTVISEYNYDTTGTYGTEVEASSRPPSITGIGCHDFGTENKRKHPCIGGCTSPMFTGPEYPCTDCCTVNIGGAYRWNGHTVCGESPEGFCYTLAQKALGPGESRNQELGYSGRADLHRRVPEIFTVHYVDIDPDGSRGFDVLHVQRHSYTACAWEVSAESSPSVFVGMADKQEAQAGNFNTPDFRRSFYRNALSMHKDWPPPATLKERIPSNLEVNKGSEYFTIKVDSAAPLITKASSLNRELEMRKLFQRTTEVDALVDQSSPVDSIRKAGTSSYKLYESDDPHRPQNDKFIGLKLSYNNVNPHPYGKNPWPVAVQSTPNTPIETTWGSGLQYKLESYRQGVSSPVVGRVGIKPTASYLNKLHERGLKDPDFDPYEDIEIVKVEDEYEDEYGCNLPGNPTEEMCVADTDASGLPGIWAFTGESVFKHTVVTTAKDHDIVTGEKIVISDSIAFLATCKNIPNAYCRNAEYTTQIDWSATTEMECVPLTDHEWHVEFLDEDINERECLEKVSKKTGNKDGEWVPGTRKSDQGLGGDIENKSPDKPKRADILRYKELPPPHCQIESHVMFKTGCRDYYGDTHSGTTHPFCCESCIDTQEGDLGDQNRPNPQRVCPRTAWDGEHVALRLTSKTFALYGESHVKYEDFESSVRINDDTNTLNTSNTARKVSQDAAGDIIDNRVYTNWQDNFDNSVNFTCEEAYTNIDSDQAQKGMCDADPRCVIAYKNGSISCFSKGICESLDSIDDSTLELKLHKRAACNASDHCFAHTTKDSNGLVTKVECVGVEAPYTANSSTDNNRLATHKPGFSTGADVGLGKPSGWKMNGQGGLTHGGMYVGQIDTKKFDYMEKVLEQNQHDMRAKWTRRGGMFEIGVGIIEQAHHFHQDFVSSSQTSAPFSSNFRAFLSDRCCNHKYPVLQPNCQSGSCDPGFTDWVGNSSTTRPIEIKDDGSASAVLNITITTKPQV